MTSNEYMNLVEEIKRLEDMLLGGDGYFRCSECGKVFDSEGRDSDSGRCEGCMPRYRREPDDNVEGLF